MFQLIEGHFASFAFDADVELFDVFGEAKGEDELIVGAGEDELGSEVLLLGDGVDFSVCIMNLFDLTKFLIAVFSDILIVCKKESNFFKFFFHDLGFEGVEILMKLVFGLWEGEMEMEVVLNVAEVLMEFMVNLIEEWVQVVFPGVEGVFIDKALKVVLDGLEFWGEVVLLFVELCFKEGELTVEMLFEYLVCVLLDFVEFGLVLLLLGGEFLMVGFEEQESRMLLGPFLGR